MIVILMGVSGCGKSTVGRALAHRTGWEFLDGDDFHPPENIAKLRSGTPLDDNDRSGWIERLRSVLESKQAAGVDAVLACSALRARHRARLLLPEAPIRLVYLKGDFSTIAARLAQRQGHFMPASLLQSQFAALEEPGPEALVIPVELPPEAAAAHIATALIA